MIENQQIAFSFYDDKLDSNKNQKKFKKKIIIFISSIIFISILIVFYIVFFKKDENYPQLEKIELEKLKENEIEDLELLVQLEKKEQEEYELKKLELLKNLDPLEKFYKSIPASLKYDYSNGNFNLDGSAFESILKSNKDYRQENSMIIYTTLSNQMAQMTKNMDISNLLDITVYHNDINFKTEINKIIDKKNES